MYFYTDFISEVLLDQSNIVFCPVVMDIAVCYKIKNTDF